MADNNFRSYRSRDTVVREEADPSGGATADPLAELARLIGQGDPYDQPEGHHGAAPAEPAGGDSGLDWAADQSYAEERPRAGARAVDDRASDDRYAAPPAAPYHEPQGPSYQGQRQATHQEPDYEDEPPPVPRFFSGSATNFSGFRDQARTAAAAHPDADYRHEARVVPELPPVAAGRALPAFASPVHDERADTGHQVYDGDRDDPADDYNDDAERPRRRSGVVLIMAVLGLVVVGTAGAFGYRAMFGGSVLPSLPPIIKADNSRIKIVPKSGQATASDAGQPGAAGIEKLAPPPEQPIDVQQSAQTAPRVVATIPIVAGSNPPSPAAEPPPSPAPVGAAPSGAMPYVPVNPSSEPVGPAPAAPPPMAVAPAMPAEPAAPQGAAAPKKIHTVTIHEGRETSRRGQAERTERTERAERAERRPRTRPVANAPLSIVPGAAGESRPAMEEPSRPAMEPRRLASAAPGALPAMSSGGGYAVQVSSQRSEAEAKAAFRMLRAKYPGQFGRREPIIRRADLGSRGVYYRAFVGPFPTLEAAAEMCGHLKAAGGNCLIPRN